MRFTRITVMGDTASLIEFSKKYSIQINHTNVYFSTVQGLLSRLFDKRFTINDLLPLSFVFKFDSMISDTRRFRKGDGSNILTTMFVTKPTLVIYTNENLSKLTPKNSIYMFNGEHPADFSIDTVELEKLGSFDENDQINYYGSITDDYYVERDQYISYGAYEFEYLTNNTRHLKSYGTHIYFRNETEIDRRFRVNKVSDLLNTGMIRKDNIFVDTSVVDYDNRFKNQVITMFFEHPKRVYGGV